MSCHTHTLNRCYLIGTTFKAIRLQSAAFLPADTFTYVVSHLGAKQKEIQGVLSGDTVVVPMSAFETITNGIKYNHKLFWQHEGKTYLLFEGELKFSQDGCQSCGDNDGIITVNVSDSSEVVQVAYDEVSITLNPMVKFESLTEEQKEELSFKYEDFTPAQLAALQGKDAIIERKFLTGNTLSFTKVIPDFYNCANPNDTDITLDLTGAVIGAETVIYSKGTNVPMVVGGRVVRLFGIYKPGDFTNKLTFTYIGEGNFTLSIENTYAEVPLYTTSPAFPYPLVTKKAVDTSELQQFKTRLNTLAPDGSTLLITTN